MVTLTHNLTMANRLKRIFVIDWLSGSFARFLGDKVKLIHHPYCPVHSIIPGIGLNPNATDVNPGGNQLT